MSFYPSVFKTAVASISPPHMICGVCFLACYFISKNLYLVCFGPFLVELKVVSTKVVGMRVMRGPDWKWDDQDGGKGSFGTVVDESASANGEGWVVVKWDSSSSLCAYRIGAESKFDLVEITHAKKTVGNLMQICSNPPTNRSTCY
jgi:hypothetical protein